MRIRLVPFALAGGLIAANAWAQHVAIGETVRRVLPPTYQGRYRGPEQTERFSRKIKIGRDGRVSVGNIAGDIIVTGGSGDEVSIEAIKRTRADRGELGSVQINIDERAGRVDVRTEHTGQNDHVSVDYTIAVPASAAVELHSVSGNLKVSNVQGAVRMETVSGSVTTTASPRVEVAKSVSGDVDLTGTSVDGDLSAGSVSGHVRARGVRARGLQLGSVSGDVEVSDVTCDRLDAKSVSGNLEVSGALARSGRYNLTSHSGTVRLILSGNTGFELNASTFSGSVHTDVPLTIGGDSDRNRRHFMSNRSMRGTYGDGSAVITVRTFSGDIVITRR
jgi:DUF4097 and DUF4098 domain-containing protein YvlB